MLTKAENELLCRVGAGTAMGEFMRAYWIPAMRSASLVADGAPRRIRLLGENFIAFRAGDGRVGFFDEGCPHRCTSLALARNEDNALTCIFHGWKIDVSGKVVDVPSEPPERRSEFAAKVRVGHYPVREAGGVVWVWLGKGEQPPQFPDFNWTRLPNSHVRSAVAIVPFNWLQGLEGQLDSAHVGILHQSSFGGDPEVIGFHLGRRIAANITLDSSPRFEFRMQPYGYREAALRLLPDGRYYARVREFVVPFYSFIPLGGKEDVHCVTISVPVDDGASAQWDIFYSLSTPLPAGNVFGVEQPDNYVTDLGSIDNRFYQDRQRMKEGSFTGLPTLRSEDFAVGVSQTTREGFVDRSVEYLGSSDTSIIRARRLLLEAARNHMKGAPALGLDQAIRWDSIRAADEIFATREGWRNLA